MDRGIEPELRTRHIQAADATRATLGLTLTDYVVTDTPLEVELRTADSGASWGTIGHPESLLRAADKLISKSKAEAIAVVARFPDDVDSVELDNYRHGQGVDTLAGAEAVISHLIVREFAIPCAHAPALEPLEVDESISPRAAAEELGYTFLPCVLVGLSRAPQFVSQPQTNSIWADEVDAVVIPHTACGGSAILSFSGGNTRIITVKDNTTALNVTPEYLGMETITVNSYLEALGVLVAHKAGISIDPLRPTMSSLSQACD
ncbi:hypothetical protein CWATWH0005_4203 [Crocosphaera watsonii WH 0005]|uniref:Uncharacterized protein n=1 Tax=Crocosphaera watsonii WH 0005 TaxID=423472 RepID=T2IV00_CROWT|nr:hypothetical protein CWATWH0005_4203 [Crocosphaera watsonii WH 0005]